MNNEFYNEAFSSNEKSIIRESEEKDNVCLFRTIDFKLEYGFDSMFYNDPTYSAFSLTRTYNATDYAKNNGSNLFSDNYLSRWVTKEGDLIHRANGGEFGNIRDDSYLEKNDFIYAYSICPVIHIDLSSELVKDAGEVTSEGNTLFMNNGYNNPTINNGITTWDCVYFGNYWQNATYETEPIEWRVLSVDGNDAFIMSDKVICCKAYNDTYEDVNWDKCTLRKWLNNDFINEAFDMTERKAIKKSAVENKAGKDERGCSDTKDSIYLLSFSEFSEKKYGFSKIGYGNTRNISGTDYAVINGAPNNRYYWKCSTGVVPKGECSVLTRLRDTYPKKYWCNQYDPMYWDDSSDLGSNSLVDEKSAICPVLHIDLSKTNIWKRNGTATIKVKY